MSNKDKMETTQSQQAVDMQASGKKHTVLYIILAIVGILLILVGIGYLVVANYYKTHFLPGTTLNGIVCDNLEAAQIAEQLEAQNQTYSLTVTDRNGEIIGTLSAEDVGLETLDALGIVEDVLASQNHMSWLMAYLGKKE